MKRKQIYKQGLLEIAELFAERLNMNDDYPEEYAFNDGSISAIVIMLHKLDERVVWEYRCDDQDSPMMCVKAPRVCSFSMHNIIESPKVLWHHYKWMISAMDAQSENESEN